MNLAEHTDIGAGFGSTHERLIEFIDGDVALRFDAAAHRSPCRMGGLGLHDGGAHLARDQDAAKTDDIIEKRTRRAPAAARGRVEFLEVIIAPGLVMSNTRMVTR